MKSEQNIRDEIDRLNQTWNEAFHLSQNANERTFPLYKDICLKSMERILVLKWVLEYNYLSPVHTYKKEDYETV
jgi:hypothetical protein